MGIKVSQLVDLGVGVYRSSLPIVSIYSVMEGHQWRVKKGEMMLEICWKDNSMK